MNNLVEDKPPTVAVWMVTYNHEAYIAQAIESVLSQQTDFKYTLFIGEDCSIDGTREICIGYANRFDDKIKLILQPRNVGALVNAPSVYKACFESGAKYVAMLEGDDYWTDPLKLQKQVDAMEADPDISLSTTDLSVLEPNGNISDYYKLNKPRPKEINTLSDFFGKDRLSPFHTSTFLLRKEVIVAYLAASVPSNLLYADWILIYTAAKMGSIHFINEKTSVYRHHATSSMRSQNGIRHFLNLITLDTFLSTHLPAPYGKMKLAGVYWYHDQLAYLYMEHGQMGKALKHFIKGLRMKPIRKPFSSYISHLRNLGYNWKKGLTS